MKKNSQMKINEIFYSIQGEGRWAGTPAIFIRFSGCNLNCDFCDTKHQEYKEYSIDEIMQEIASYPSKYVVLTGGEPTLQITEEFLKTLRVNGKHIQIETNGINRLPYGLIHLIDWVTCSPKFGIIPKIQRIDELKVVYEGQDVSKYNSLEIVYNTCRYLQPCDRHSPEINQENLNSVINFIKKNPQWKLSLQTQKILDVQ